MRLLELFAGWVAYRRARRRWRDAMTLLTLVLICALLNISFFCCGLVGYTLQRIGILPTSTPVPAEATLFLNQGERSLAPIEFCPASGLWYNVIVDAGVV